VPTRLIEIAVAGQPRRNAGTVVVAYASGSHGDGPRLGPGADRHLPDGFVATFGATGKAGEVLTVPVPGANPCWLLGVGSGREPDWRSAGAALTRAVASRVSTDHEAGKKVVRSAQLLLPDEVTGDQVAGLTLGAMLGGYEFKVTNQAAEQKPNALYLVTSAEKLSERDEAVHRAAVLARATGLARDLANTPSNVKDPAWLARAAERALRGVPGLGVTVRDERWLTEHGFGGVLAVGSGSVRPPRLIEMSWQPSGRRARHPHLVLVGKGITFDTGGISIKPNAGMHLMRTDMAGGGAVIAAMRAIAQLRLPLRVTGLVPAAENHVSGSAYRPGDIVRHYGGLTTEVVNTDAEGRLVLADALVYARRDLGAELLVDVATLTGAMKVALGLRTGGLFASSDELAERVLAAGQASAEQWWRMPLSEDHAEEVTSDVADLRQAPPGPAGIAAALYLREFTGGLPWAHMDIAGPARADKSQYEVVAGATGFATRTLVELAATLGTTSI
jgi:leucyl aminopeptidase